MKAAAILAAAALALAVGACAARPGPPLSWVLPAEPFAIGDDLYYVGTAGLSSFLIETPEGLILVDGGLPSSARRIARNVEALGFDMRRVKVLLNTHAHVDHAGGLAELKRRAPGATVFAMEQDAGALGQGVHQDWERFGVTRYPPVRVDVRLKDGESVSLGGLRLTAHLTPGHSPGCTTWTFVTPIAGAPERVMINCSMTLGLYRYGRRPAGLVRAYRRTFERLGQMQADVFLAPHAEEFGMSEKRRRLAYDPRAFVDSRELPRRVAEKKGDFQQWLAGRSGR